MVERIDRERAGQVEWQVFLTVFAVDVALAHGDRGDVAGVVDNARVGDDTRRDWVGDWVLRGVAGVRNASRISDGDGIELRFW